jgi:hypothetical protein
MLGAWIAFGLVAGLVGGALVLGDGVKKIRRGDRYVTVKGLVERDVTADLAVWPLKFKASGDDLGTTQAALEASKQKVLAFLKAGGIDDQSIELRGVRVVDKKSMEFGEFRPDQLRYIIDATVMVRSGDVQRVASLSQRTSDLVREGVLLVDDNPCQSGPSFVFTRLNEIKPDMLAEATRNARRAAEQFAADSGSKVGSIRQANQGVFSIVARDRVTEAGDTQGGCVSDSDPGKRVRVVTTIDYFLVD